MNWQQTVTAIEHSEGKEAAVRFLIDAVSQESYDAPLRLDIALRLKAMSQLDNAIEALTPLLQSKDYHLRFRALLEVGTCLRLSGRLEEAEHRMQAARVQDPGSHWPILGLADIRASRGRLAEVIETIHASYDELRPDGKAAAARKEAEFLAATHFGRSQDRPACAPRSPGQIQALARAGLMMMVKDEEDILSHNLEHHYALGFRSFCILDNGSTDESAKQISAFRERHRDAVVLYIFDQVVGYYQSAKMAIFQDALRRYAALADIAVDWMFFVDADEFIAFTGSEDAVGREALQAALSDPTVKLLVMHWLNAATPDTVQRLSADLNPFEVFSKRMTRLDPVVPKIAFRTGLGLEPMMGNHFVASYEDALDSTRVLALNDWYMMHFPLRSIEHVRRKVINGGQAFLAAKGMETHGDHWRARYALYEKNGEPVLEAILRQHIESIR